MQSATITHTPAYSCRSFLAKLTIVGLGLAFGTAGAYAQTTSQTSNPAQTETSLAASASTAGSGTVGTFEVQVYSRAGGDQTPSGPVTLVEGTGDTTREISSAALDANGTATITTSNFSAGDHAIRAEYRGDAAHATSASQAAVVHAQASAVPGYTISSNPTTLNVVAGTTGTATITLNSQNGFNQYVGLSCSGLPLAATCSFTPANVPVGAANGTSTMTIETTAPSGVAHLQNANYGLVYAFLLPGMLGLLGLRFSRIRAVRALALVLVAGGIIAGGTSCSQRYGYLHNPPARSLGTPVGTSTITVEAISINGSQVTSPGTPLTVTLTVTAAPTTKK